MGAACSASVAYLLRWVDSNPVLVHDLLVPGLLLVGLGGRAARVAPLGCLGLAGCGGDYADALGPRIRRRATP